MLNLYVMRHSKSSWNEHNINDFERPLSKRGRKDIKLIIAFLKKKKITFDLAYVSSSKRTKQTFKILKKFENIQFSISSSVGKLDKECLEYINTQSKLIIVSKIDLSVISLSYSSIHLPSSSQTLSVVSLVP